MQNPARFQPAPSRSKLYRAPARPCPPQIKNRLKLIGAKAHLDLKSTFPNHPLALSTPPEPALKTILIALCALALQGCASSPQELAALPQSQPQWTYTVDYMDWRAGIFRHSVLRAGPDQTLAIQEPLALSDSTIDPGWHRAAGEPLSPARVELVVSPDPANPLAFQAQAWLRRECRDEFSCDVHERLVDAALNDDPRFSANPTVAEFAGHGVTLIVSRQR